MCLVKNTLWVRCWHPYICPVCSALCRSRRTRRHRNIVTTRHNLASWLVQAAAGLLVIVISILVQDKAVLYMIYFFMVSTITPILYLRGAQ